MRREKDYIIRKYIEKIQRRSRSIVLIKLTFLYARSSKFVFPLVPIECGTTKFPQHPLQTTGGRLHANKILLYSLFNTTDCGR